MLLSSRQFVRPAGKEAEVLPLGEPPFNPEMAGHFWQSFATSAANTVWQVNAAAAPTQPFGAPAKPRVAEFSIAGAGTS
jgi:hypothetical protein